MSNSPLSDDEDQQASGRDAGADPDHGADGGADAGATKASQP